MKKDNRLNKKALARRIARQGGMSIELAEACLTSFVQVFRDIMRNDGEIILQNMGTFSVSHSKERQLYNPTAGRKITLGPRQRIKFTPSTTLCLNGGRQGKAGSEQ